MVRPIRARISELEMPWRVVRALEDYDFRVFDVVAGDGWSRGGMLGV